MSQYYAETKYGFDWGAAKITRCFSDDKKGWVTVLITTPKDELQIYITRTGKVRIHSRKGEWTYANKKTQPRAHSAAYAAAYASAQKLKYRAFAIELFKELAAMKD